MMMDDMLERNRQWALQKKRENPIFFTHLSSGQSPSIFWIGCCDSRLIPTEIFNLSVGDVFVQTNIANQINSQDQAMMGALRYAVDVLNVSHIVVCGHTCCGGIQAALKPNLSVPSFVKDWVAPISDRYRKKVVEGKIQAEDVVELNVRDQVQQLKTLLGECSRLPLIWGQVFDMKEGRVNVLVKPD